MTKFHVLILAAFAVAFFLPVLALPAASGPEAAKVASAARADGVDATAARLVLNQMSHRSSGTIVGHEAARLVWNHLRVTVDEGNWRQASSALWWNLANPLFVLALLLAVGKRRGIALGLAAVAAASAGRWLVERDLTSRLSVGYWLWLAAVAALAIHCLVDTLNQMRNSAKWV